MTPEEIANLFQSKLDILEAKLDHLESTLNHLESKLAKHDVDIEILKKRITKLQDQKVDKEIK